MFESDRNITIENIKRKKQILKAKKQKLMKRKEKEEPMTQKQIEEFYL